MTWSLNPDFRFCHCSFTHNIMIRGRQSSCDEKISDKTKLHVFSISRSRLREHRKSYRWSPKGEKNLGCFFSNCYSLFWTFNIFNIFIRLSFGDKVSFHLFVRIQYLCMTLWKVNIVQRSLGNHDVHFSLHNTFGPLGPLGPLKRAQTDLHMGSGPEGPQLGPVAQ